MRYEKVLVYIVGILCSIFSACGNVPSPAFENKSICFWWTNLPLTDGFPAGTMEPAPARHICFCQKKYEIRKKTLVSCNTIQYINMIYYVFFCVGSIGTLDLRSQFIYEHVFFF